MATFQSHNWVGTPTMMTNKSEKIIGEQMPNGCNPSLGLTMKTNWKHENGYCASQIWVLLKQVKSACRTDWIELCVSLLIKK